MENYTTRDKNIRSRLLRDLKNYQKESLILEEFSLAHGKARVDIAVLGKEIHGYELKGDLDNLLRLEHQSNIYNHIFDKVTLVVGKSHVIDALRIIPDWWGVMVARMGTKQLELITIRTARNNPAQDLYSIASMLWKEEALKMISDNQKRKKYKKRPKRLLCEELVHTLEENDLKDNVRNQLLERYRLCT